MLMVVKNEPSGKKIEKEQGQEQGKEKIEQESTKKRGSR